MIPWHDYWIKMAPSDIFMSNFQAAAIFTDPYKGIMTPPVLIDLTGDKVKDIVFSTFNSTVVAIDGEKLTILWNTTFPQSETYA